MQEIELLWKQQAEYNDTNRNALYEAVPDCDISTDTLADKFRELSAKTDGQPCKVEQENMTVLYATANLTCLSRDAVYGCIQLLVNIVANGSASCSNVIIDETDPAKAYGYGFLMVASICLISLTGVLLLPFLKNNDKFSQVYLYTNTLLVALGTSALVCSAVLHLLPEVIQIEQNQRKAFLWKGIVIIAGLYIFCLFEMILHSFNLDIHLDHGSTSHHSSSRDASSESDVAEETDKTDSVGNRDGDLVGNNHLDKATVPLVQKELRNEKSKLISDSEKARSFRWRSIKPIAWTVICGNIVHNFSDGLTLGAAISQSLSLGVSAAVAIAFHEVPHELGNFAILLSAGFSWYMALLINFVLATTSMVGFILGVAIGTESHVSTQWILALAAGLFLYVALVDLLPELIHTDKKGYKLFFLTLMTNIGFFISFIVIVLIAVFEKQLNITINKVILV